MSDQIESMHCAFNVATVERDRGGRGNEAGDARRRQYTKVGSRLNPRSAVMVKIIGPDWRKS